MANELLWMKEEVANERKWIRHHIKQEEVLKGGSGKVIKQEEAAKQVALSTEMEQQNELGRMRGIIELEKVAKELFHCNTLLWMWWSSKTSCIQQEEASKERKWQISHSSKWEEVEMSHIVKWEEASNYIVESGKMQRGLIIDWEEAETSHVLEQEEAAIKSWTRGSSNWVASSNERKWKWAASSNERNGAKKLHHQTRGSSKWVASQTRGSGNQVASLNKRKQQKSHIIK